MMGVEPIPRFSRERMKHPLRAGFGRYHACGRSSPAPFRYIPASNQGGTRGGGDRDERWRKFVGSISRPKSFSSKRLTKNSWRKCNGARALKSKQSLLQLHNWPSTHTDVPLVF